jgi:hypothetical protein
VIRKCAVGGDFFTAEPQRSQRVAELGLCLRGGKGWARRPLRTCFDLVWKRTGSNLCP